MPNASEFLRRLPAVDRILRDLAASGGLERFPRQLAAAEARAALAEARQAIRKGARPPENFAAAVEARLERLARPGLRPVLNASGVILHTNLGRAPLSRAALDAAVRAGAGYSNLEYDLANGRRGQRDVHAADLLAGLLAAPALVVNNNAAAIFLILNELSAGGETVLSRGEMIEIGDGFRIPEILARSGAILREVGTTNRTTIGDYREALNSNTRALLRVHRSNFRIVGFSAQPTLQELAALAQSQRLPLVEDLGSGCLYDLAPHGLEREPLAAESLRAGADLICFSGDKLLGGPQAGIIAGRPELVQRLRRNPLFRALRVDKLIYATLAETLRAHLLESYDDIPALRMIRLSADEIRQRAERLAAGLDKRARIEAASSLLGGGSTPEQRLPSYALAIDPVSGESSAQLERRLRAADPPVIARIERDRLLLDLRTIAPEDDPGLLAILQRVLAGPEP